MNDSHRVLEQTALRNVRALVERIERDDALNRKRQVYALGIAAVPIALLLLLLVGGVRQTGHSEQRGKACELDAWNARAAEFERGLRESNPGMPYRDVQKRLERERPSLMAAAAAQCSTKAR